MYIVSSSIAWKVAQEVEHGKMSCCVFDNISKKFNYFMDYYKLDVVKKPTYLEISVACNLKPVTQCQQAYLFAQFLQKSWSIAQTVRLYAEECCVSAWSPDCGKDKALCEL